LLNIFLKLFKPILFINLMTNNISIQLNEINVEQENVTIKPKRGRRPKKLLETENVEIDNDIIVSQTLINTELDNEENQNVEEKHVCKKRGRKPKGGKIVQQSELQVKILKDNRPNVIMHLKCSLKDLINNGEYNSDSIENTIDPYNYNEIANNLNYEIVKNSSSVKMYINNSNNDIIENTNVEFSVNDDKNNVEMKEIWRKLKILEHNLHLNNISDKKSACFWCSYDFDNPPIYIPKHFIKNSYHVYGCFCSPECGVAYLMNESIDSSIKFERYHLINSIYSKIYEYKKNIKPAPNPYYMLEKFYGNLTIQEYRALLRSERLFLIVDKPLTRILPEFHEDNDDFIINNKIIPSNNYQLKKKIQKKTSQTKNNIMNETFGIS